MRWHEIINGADDCSALYDSGIARRGTSVYVRVDSLTVRSEHESEIEAINAYLEAQSVLDS